MSINLSDFFTLSDDLTPPVPTAEVSLERAYGLRPYQAAAIRAIEDGWKEVSKQMVVKATGTGKTPLVAIVAKREVERGGRVLVLAHTDELIDQARDKIVKFAKVAAAKEKAGSYASRMDRIVVGSVQTMSGDLRLSSWPAKHFSLVVVDECFPAGTLIDGTPIELIRPGDLIQCFDHNTQQIVQRPVLHIFKNRIGGLVKIHLSSGHSLVCTPSHPVFTYEHGYMPAANIQPGAVVAFNSKCRTPLRKMRRDRVEARELQQKHREEDQMRKVQECGAGESPRRGVLKMQELWERCSVPWEAPKLQLARCRKAWSRVLLRILHSGVHLLGSLRQGKESCRVQPDARTHKDEAGESYVDARSEREDGCKEIGADFSQQGRERSTNQAATGPAQGDRLADGACHRDGPRKGQVRELAELLQGGPSGSDCEACHRSGRADPQAQEVEVSGPPEGGGLVGIRVDRVEVLEQGSGYGVGESGYGDYVYNLEVEEHHNYFANDILVHNCHRTLAASYLKVLNRFHGGGAKILGVTATADRGDKKELGDFYEKIAYEYNLRHAVRDGWLIRPVVETMPLSIDLRGVHVKGKDLDQTEVGHRLSPFLAKIAAVLAARSPRCMMCFLPSVETARQMADALNAAGVKADWVSGDRPERKEVIAAFKAGKLQAVVNMALLTEGFDHDAVDTMVILRPTKIRSLFVQMSGRAARPLNSIVPALGSAANAYERLEIIKRSAKPFYRILDFLWLHEKHDLIQPAALVASKPEVAQSMKGVQGDLMEAEERAERDLLKKLEEEVRKNARRQAKVIDPLAVATESHDVELATYEPETANDALAPTEKQLHILRQNGIDVSKVKYRGHASALIYRVIERHKQGLATFRQLHFLSQLGIDGANMSRDEASAAIEAKIGKRE